ncbi:hypothetical protein ABH922_001702 [Rhodococcus sp. 27YEA15]|uniref:sensor domain-containing protein n=1 Tax=Rhodococcus sp. 27YEA15 TaxID=3156259 RepID=UPI003C7E7EB8
MQGTRATAPHTVAGLVVIGLATGLMSGCAQSTSGQAIADHRVSQSDAGTPTITSAPSAVVHSASLDTLLLAPSEFPSPFDAVTLPAQAVPMAAPDLVGVPRGATVQPPECAQPKQDYGPDSTVMAVGTDNATRTTISVELTRDATGRLTEWEERTRRCHTTKVTANGVTSTVETEILPPAPVDADESMALRRTVTTPTAAGGTQTMLTLLAQVDDVRISVTLMTFASVADASAPLDQTFTAAVAKVRKG